MNIAVLISKARSTLLGHVVFLEVFWGVPMASFFIWKNYTDGALTMRWALWCIFVSAIGALFVAFLFWFTMGRRLLQRQLGAPSASADVTGRRQ
jgi:hypothetical protein